MDWDPQRYAEYAGERGRPFLDLLAQVGATAPRQIVDAGCGSGELTALLAERWPAARVHGFDSSPQMVAQAAGLTTERLTFADGTVTEWRPGADVDVLVSNAVLQWVPEHLTLLGRWADALPAGAWLAWQVPGNFAAPSHVLMRELTEEPRWRATLDGVLRHADAVHEPATYDRVLRERGWQVSAWETTYLHVLPGADPVLDWVRGTGLRPVLGALSAADAAEFTAQYGTRLRAAYPGTPHGTLFPFRRIFCVGHKP